MGEILDKVQPSAPLESSPNESRETGTSLRMPPLSFTPILRRILVVDKNPEVGATIQKALSPEEFSIVWLSELGLGLSFLRTGPFEMILLGWNPEGNSVSNPLENTPGETLDPGKFLELVRNFSKVPIVVVTLCGELEFRLQAFALGADDVLIYPFHGLELLSRIRAIFRRTKPEPKKKDRDESSLIREGTVVLDVANQTVSCNNGRPVPVTAKEMEIIRFLLQTPCKPITKEVLNRVLFAGLPLESANRCEVFVHRIRRKLGKTFIRNNYGEGFFIDPY